MNDDTKITPRAIRAQLGQILVSESFIRCQRMQRFLQFIVEEALAGRADQLGEYAIGIAVFDRGTDFETAVDPIVRNDARRLRLKLSEYYRQTQSRPALQVVIDVPKGGYVPVFLPGISDDGGVRTDSPRRLAVLPFEVLSTAPEGPICGRALCMSLTASLTDLDGVEAVAHGYVREQPIRETASELQLSHVIHGSVLQSRGRCRVIVNLIRVTTGTQMWAREYDFEIGDSLAVQSEIAATVRREVTARVGKQGLPRTTLVLAA